MPRIGIMTYYAVHNFGAALQAYALQQNIERFGAKAELLRFYDTHNESISLSNGFSSLKRSLVSLILKNKELRSNFIWHFPRYVRLKRFTRPNANGFDSFLKEYLHTSIEPYYEYEDLIESNKRYCGFIAGSDMVWTPIGQNLSAYFLQFADKEKRFSYAPSMTGCHIFSEDDATNIKEYLKGMDFISCREQEGIDYVKKTIGRDATLVVDPTLLFSKEDWCKELNILILKPAKPYILCYNFGGLPQKIEQEVYRIAKEKNMDVRYVPLSHKESDSELKLGHFGPYGPREFVELFLNASFCVTNTFHGFLFSLISENPFVVVHREKNNAWKANETRISNLMDILGITERYIELDADITENFLTLDYSKLNEKIAERRQSSLAYLKNVVENACKNELNGHRISKMTANTVCDLSIKQCTGCGICLSICPFDAIQMIENEEGFMIPQIDNEKCKECGKCAKSCPSIHRVEKKYPLDTKLCLSKDKLLISNSASGGLFITIAKYYIEQLHGVVYGVVFDKDFNCMHKEATTLEELRPMQNSKYVQSNVGDCYNKAKQRLEEGRYVLFTGTPCQIAALKLYLKKDYDNLLTLDVVCHGVPNQKYWKKYITENPKNAGITGYSFRTRHNKELGKTTLAATVSSGKNKEVRFWSNSAYYAPFIRNESFRMSCYYCQYARKERVSDITMGDCDSEKYYSQFYSKESKSIALLNTEKGVKYWDKLRDKFIFTNLDYLKEVKENIPLRTPSPMPQKRACIYIDLENLPWKEFQKKYIQKRNVLSNVKCLMFKLLNK